MIIGAIAVFIISVGMAYGMGYANGKAAGAAPPARPPSPKPQTEKPEPTYDAMPMASDAEPTGTAVGEKQRPVYRLPATSPRRPRRKNDDDDKRPPMPNSRQMPLEVQA